MKSISRIALVAFLAAGCGDDSTEADRLGIGAECSESAECDVVDDFELDCLTQFKGGYCGLEGCEGDEDCPEGSACVTQDGDKYCFRVCDDKPDCNHHRESDNEANCVGSIDFVEPRNERKACEPPSGS